IHAAGGGFLTARGGAADGSGFDVAHLKDGNAEDEKGQAQTGEQAHGLADLPPRDGIGKQELPAVEIVAEEVLLQVVEVGNVHHDAINHDQRERGDRGGGGLDVAAREHEREAHDGDGLGDHEEMCEQESRQGVGKIEKARSLFRQLREESAGDRKRGTAEQEAAGRKRRHQQDGKHTPAIHFRQSSRTRVTGRDKTIRSVPSSASLLTMSPPTSATYSGSSE